MYQVIGLGTTHVITRTRLDTGAGGSFWLAVLTGEVVVA
jgi:hypothetical protein